MPAAVPALMPAALLAQVHSHNVTVKHPAAPMEQHWRPWWLMLPTTLEGRLTPDGCTPAVAASAGAPGHTSAEQRVVTASLTTGADQRWPRPPRQPCQPWATPGN
jgi:hypothetical protein